VSVVTTPAILLRAHPYSESSLVLRFFAESLGTVAVMAKGLRRQGGRSGPGLDVFAGGILTLYMKENRELQTMKDFETIAPRRGLARNVIRFGGAAVMAELVLRHAGEAAVPILYETLERALDAIDQAPDDAIIESVLGAGWGLVGTMGYSPVLDTCVTCGTALDSEEVGRFDLDAGGIRCAACAAGTTGARIGPGARAQLSGLLDGSVDRLSRPLAHVRLLSDFVTYHVSGSRPLESFGFLASLLESDQDEI